MAGIIGYYDPDGILRPDTLNVMARAQFHKEFYNYNPIKREWGAIGIVDNRTTGHSHLITSEEHQAFIACRGDTQESDLISLLMNTDGSINEDNLNKINGHFVSALLHDKSRTIHLINDRFGLYPIYIAHYKSALIFSSEQKSLLATGLIKNSIDQIAISLILSIGEVCGDRTLFENIKALPSSTILTASHRGIVSKKYWQYNYVEDKTLSWQESVTNASSALENSLYRIGEQHKTLGVPLSGGLDSRLLLSVASRYSKVNSYTWGVEHSKDIIVARKVAQRLGSRHSEIYVDGNYLETMASSGVWLTEGLTSVTNFHVLPHVDRVADENNVILDGLAGDAILGGSFINDAWLHEPDEHKAGKNIWNWRYQGWLGEQYSGMLQEISNDAREDFINIFQKTSGKTSMDRAMAFLIDNRVRRNSICGTEILRSRLGTYHPFFDNGVIDATRIIPHQWRCRHKFYLSVLKKLSPDAASIMWDRTALPVSVPYWMSWFSLATHKVMNKTADRVNLKLNFFSKNPSPFADWFRTNLNSYVCELLLDESTLNRGWVPREVIISAVSGHMSNQFDASLFIGSLIRLELFARLFIDDLDAAINEFSAMPDNMEIQ